MVSLVNRADYSNKKFSPSVCNNEKLIVNAQKESIFVHVGKGLIVLRKN